VAQALGLTLDHAKVHLARWLGAQNYAGAIPAPAVVPTTETLELPSTRDNELQDNVFASASQSLMDFLFDEFNRAHQRASLLTSNNLCIPADAFRAIGGFDTAFPGAGGEDREICLRWAHAGHRLVYVPEAIVFHAHDMNLGKFVRQHLAYGRGAALLRRRARERGYGPIPLERSSFYWDLLRYPQRAASIRNRGLESVLFAVSQVANTVGYFQARFKEYAKPAANH